MKRISIILLLGALTFVVLSMAYQARSAQAQTGGESIQLQATASPTAAAPSTESSEAQTSSMVEEWDKICVRKIPYTILSIPENATFEVVQPEGVVPTPEHGSSNPNIYACDSVGVFGGKQVVVCRGPSLSSFTLKVSGGGNTEDFKVDLKACPIKPILPVEPVVEPE